MPLIKNSTYRTPFYVRNNHFQTIYNSVIRNVGSIDYQRERITTPDHDFLDLDWSRVGARRLVLALHGLEGSSSSNYIISTIKCFNREGWDAVAFNFRGCSGEPNRLLRTYHIGETSDLDFVLNYLTALRMYDEIAIVGFSLGGNVALKYLGERSSWVHPQVRKAVAVSVPCQLTSSINCIDSWYNYIYRRTFLDSIKAKLRIKSKMFPDQFIPESMYKATTFFEFDDLYTSIIHDFDGAADFYEKSSSLQFIPNIRIPTLLINAADDSFLSSDCYPVELAKQMPNFFLEIPENGGHVGFIEFSDDGFFWIEKRIVEFLS